MLTITRSANLTVLHAWLCGGQTDSSGDTSEGFHCLQVCRPEGEESLIIDGKVDRESIKQTVVNLIEEYADNPSSSLNDSYFYWDDYYKFRMPKPKNLEKLIDRIYKEQCESWEEQLKEKTED